MLVGRYNMEEKIIRLAKVFKALSCSQRLKLFKLIYKLGKEKSCTCCDPIQKVFTTASEHLNISKSTISHHLKELQNAGLINCIRKGQHFDCTINIDILNEIKEFMDK